MEEVQESQTQSSLGNLHALLWVRQNGLSFTLVYACLNLFFFLCVALLIVAGQEEENEVITESSAFVKGEPAPEFSSNPPKVDSEVEVLHEKVSKQIIKEGHGQKPSKYSTCFCKYHTQS